MTNDLKELDEILYRNLQPWLEHNVQEEKFAGLHGEIREVTPVFPPWYQVEFERPFNHKTKYYTKLIDREVVNTVNRIYTLIKADEDPRLIKYWLEDTLNKKLRTRLIDLGKLIKERDYTLTYIDPKKTSFDMDIEHKSDTYVVQFLKLAYMRIYLELQEAFREWINDPLIPEDFYIQLLFEPVPEKSFLKKILTIEIQPLADKSVLNEPELQYQPVVRSFTYKKLPTDPDKLADLCASLKKDNLIAQDTSLTNFKKVFSGKKITKPIVWTGNPSELSYFIKLIHNTHKLVDDLRQKQWKTVAHCFVDKDGNPFPDTIRKLQTPKLTARLVEKSVEHLL